MKNPIFHDKLKLIDVRLYFFRDVIKRGNISNEKIITNRNLADALTKPLNILKIDFYFRSIGCGSLD